MRLVLRHTLPLLIFLAVVAAIPVHGQGFHDPLAVTLGSPGFEVASDGSADAAPALQRAIDRVQETTHQGVVLIPQGRYRFANTVHVWSGIRLLGIGPERPVFVLALSTPGFQQGSGKYMLWFTDERPAPGLSIGDASEFTFYSALSNIDFEIGEGNPVAVAIRFNVAQHGFIAHARFRLGSARAAIEAVGNQASDLDIEGGDYAIVTGKTSPAWQFLLMDSRLSGQRIAAISTHEAGFTLIPDRFAHVPIAIEIPPGQVEQLYGRDLSMQDISRAVLVAGDVQNLRSEITLEHIACDHVARFLEGASTIPSATAFAADTAFYLEDRLSLGLEISPDGRETGIRLRHAEHPLAHALAPVPTDIPALPPMTSWVDVRTLGAKGDGATDDTAALQRAIDTHPTLLLTSGLYRLTRSLRLRPDTTLLGLNPATAQLLFLDSDPALQGAGQAIPLLLAPSGSHPIVAGIGFATGNANPRAAGVEWRAGAGSLLDDASFIRGHTAYNALLAPAAPPPVPEAPRPSMQLDAQHPSLWVHDGGGGILRGIWSHAGTARAGLLVENTETPTSVYQFSCEHHLRQEVVLHHVTHWRLYALQTEEEKPEGADAVAVTLDSSHDLLFANTFLYRVSRNVAPKLNAIEARASDAVFANIRNFSQTRLAFDNSVFDQTSGISVRAHDLTSFALTPALHAPSPLPLPPAFAPEAQLTRLAGGFSNADGLTADDRGIAYFTDAAEHAIFRWNAAANRADLLAKVEASPMVLGFVAPDTLLAIDNEKSVTQIQISSGRVTPVSAVDQPQPGTTLLLPVGLHNELWTLNALLAHRGYIYRAGSNTALRSALLPEPRSYFYATGSSTAILAGGTWRPLLQSSQLAPFRVGDRHLLVSEDDAKAYTAELTAPETLSTDLFAQRGGTSVVSDAAGNVYLASGQVFIYDATGKQTGVLELPERPGSLCFGGPDRRTLFIAARAGLYAIRTASPGR